jgi:Zinc binding domain
MCQGNGCKSHCDNHCEGCHIGCPICGQKGLKVKVETILSLTKPLIKEQLGDLEQETFSLCTSKTCDVAYFNHTGIHVLTNQLTVPIWFKNNKEEYLVCYCRRITLDDIIEAVNFIKQDVTIERVLTYLNKDLVKTDCLHNNPTSESCERLFNNAIKYALNQKNS